MFNLFLTYLATFGLSNNIVINSGVGVGLFGREKQYRFFRYINTLFLMLGICICAFATYFLDYFVCSKFNLYEIKIGVVVLIAGLYNLLISFLWGKISLFGHYLYERSCSYVFDMVFTIFVAMTLDLTLAIIPFLMSVIAVMVVVFVMNFVIGFFVEGINKSSLPLCCQNVTARLFLIAIFAMLLYYANMLI